VEANVLPRLLAGHDQHRTLSLEEHERLFTASVTINDPLAEIAAAGLIGRGGAGFPTARKAALIRDQHGHNKFMVVNAMEGEPTAHKDRTLMVTNPHLILDGAETLGRIIGARHIAVCVARDNPQSVNAMERAIKERSRRSARGPSLELHTAPWRYVAGEESALVRWLDGGETLPQYRPHRPTILKIGRAPVLVDNAETCAHVALIMRYGAQWFKSMGTAEHPGSMLVAVTGDVAKPVVLEVAPGTPMRSILAAANASVTPQALLLGGYGGSWVSGQHVETPFDNGSLAALEASVGAGIMITLGKDACGLLESHRVVRWMANESARQCGPCAFGLPAIVDNLAHIVKGSRDARTHLGELRSRLGMVEGRGACRHPDGVVRMVRSALKVFAHDLERHVSGQPCAGTRLDRRYVAVPTLEREEELIWE
jgi:NADH:ubiquinone oxidoreductase subunit F (NADH-binding)